MSKRSKRITSGNNELANDGAGAAVIVDDAGNGGNVDGGDSGSESIAAATVDPGSVGPSDEPTDSQPRRRGRPPGSGAGKKQTAKVSSLVNVSGLEKLLVGIHGGLAVISSRAEWMLDTTSPIFDGDTEAKFLASSVKAVADHYGTGFLDQKTLDWCNLIQCLAIVYGGRIYAIRSNPKAKPAPRHPTVQQAAQVHNPAPPRTSHVTPSPVSEFNGSGNDAGRVDIAGVGSVELPDDNPLSPNYKPRWN
jgi:hypothetical protein